MSKKISAIKDSLLVLLNSKELGEITMTEIAQIANVSRSTLYTYFNNPYAVFEACVIDFGSNLTSLKSQIKKNNDLALNNQTYCEDGSEKVPFCVALRTNNKYKALVRDPNFLTTFLRIMEYDKETLTPVSLSNHANNMTNISENLSHFQISGCYAMALNCKNDAEFNETRKMIDAFIRGGLRNI